jgi:hypothetical protein
MSSLTRVLRTQGTTLTHTWWVGETATDPSGPVTCTVRRLDGTQVATGTAANIVGAGRSEFALTGQANVDTFTVDWSGPVAGSTRTERDYVEICGGFLFELAEARSTPPPLDAAKYPTTLLAALRVEVEQEAERIARTTFVPRFCRVALVGTGHESLMTPHADLRALRAVSVDGQAWTPEQLAGVSVSEAGVLTTSGWWPPPAVPGRRNIVVEYEHGLDLPSADVRKAAIVRLRSRAGMVDTSVPHRAVSFTAVEGGTYRLSTPSRESTGIPDVDAAYQGARQDLGGFA